MLAAFRYTHLHVKGEHVGRQERPAQQHNPMMEGTWDISRNVRQLCTQARLTLYDLLMQIKMDGSHDGGDMRNTAGLHL